MKRKRRIMLLCHCILNTNSKVEGLSETPAGLPELVQFLMENEIGLIQLPCPELTCYGIKRWGHVKDQFDHPHFRTHCNRIFQPILEQVLDYLHHGCEVLGILGINGSPSCGVHLTCRGSDWGGEIEGAYGKEQYHVEMTSEPGIFIEEIQQRLKDHHLNILCIGIDETDMESTRKQIVSILLS